MSKNILQDDVSPEAVRQLEALFTRVYKNKNSRGRRVNQRAVRELRDRHGLSPAQVYRFTMLT